MLTGEYSGLVFEYGSSVLAQCEGKNSFIFDYALYEVPQAFDGPALRKKADFNEFIAYIIVDVIKARMSDPKEIERHHEAASAKGKVSASIHIDESYYRHKDAA